VRTNLFAEIDDGNGPPLAQVHDVNGASVRTGLSHPCVSVDGNVAEATVRGDSHLVSINVNSHCGQNLFGHGIYEQNAVLHLVSNEKKIVWARVSRDAARKQKACEKTKCPSGGVS
jgi:hypothetical protein